MLVAEKIELNLKGIPRKAWMSQVGLSRRSGLLLRDQPARARGRGAGPRHLETLAEWVDFEIVEGSSNLGHLASFSTHGRKKLAFKFTRSSPLPPGTFNNS
jgi:hypothetical protein